LLVTFRVMELNKRECLTNPIMEELAPFTTWLSMRWVLSLTRESGVFSKFLVFWSVSTWLCEIVIYIYIFFFKMYIFWAQIFHSSNIWCLSSTNLLIF
jgi:hypothetical protein